MKASSLGSGSRKRIVKSTASLPVARGAWTAGGRLAFVCGADSVSLPEVLSSVGDSERQPSLLRVRLKHSKCAEGINEKVTINSSNFQ